MVKDSKIYRIRAAITPNSIRWKPVTLATTIPKLLSVLEIKGAMVSINAMGCPRDIARLILEAQTDYILALKGNPGETSRSGVAHFNYTPIASEHTDITKGHGRIEERTCRVITDLSMFDEAVNWSNMMSLIEINSSPTEVWSAQTTRETRYYISSRIADTKSFNAYIRGHWGIKNKLDWILDVLLGEDNCGVRKGHADENFAMIRKIALNMINLEQTSKISKKVKQKKAMRNDQFRQNILKT